MLNARLALTKVKEDKELIVISCAIIEIKNLRSKEHTHIHAVLSCQGHWLFARPRNLLVLPCT
jgi:hypothetical protein